MISGIIRILRDIKSFSRGLQDSIDHQIFGVNTTLNERLLIDRECIHKVYLRAFNITGPLLRCDPVIITLNKENVGGEWSNGCNIINV